MDASEKRLNEMNRLGDMGHFPAVVNAGATVNVLVTILATWWVEPRWPALAGVWLAAVLAVNLLPVVLLRMTMGTGTESPKLGEMDFFKDQHKFRIGCTWRRARIWRSGCCWRGPVRLCGGWRECWLV